MRELVLEILEIPPPAGPFDPPPARPPLRAFAYLHLGLAHLDVPFAAVRGGSHGLVGGRTEAFCGVWGGWGSGGKMRAYT